MGDFKKEVKDIIESIGGKENVISASHCVTRLRLILKDEHRVDKERLESIEIVKGSFLTSGQFQIIIGNKVKQLYKEFISEVGLGEVSKEEMKVAAQQKMGVVQKIVGGFAEIFTPLLPAIIAGGLILGARNIMGDIKIFGDGTQALTDIYPVAKELYSFLWVLGEAIFHFLPVGVTWSTVKKYGGTEILGIVLGIALVSPQLMNAYQYGSLSGEALKNIPAWDFGLFSIQKIGYQAQVIPAMLAGIFMSKLEVKIKKYVPELCKMIIVPLIVLLLTLLVSYTIIGPFSRVIGNQLANIFNILLKGQFKIFGAILFGALYAPLVITGVHHTFLAIDLQLISQGGTMIWPMIALSNIAQGASAIMIMFMKRKDQKIKSLALSSGISAWLGVTEPAMFGINLKYMYPFYGALIGSATAAVFCTLCGTLANSIGIGGLPAFLAIQPKFWLKYIIAMLIAVIVSMIATYILGKGKEIKERGKK